jgi:FemAB-related protein (PEP-CTERM system-associated)
MKCCELQGYDPRWDEFVRNHPHGTFFHLLQWRDVVERNFGYIPCYLYAQEKDEIVGVLPLFLVKSALFGKSLISIPLAVYGGILSQISDARTLLFETAKDLGVKQKVKYIELRGNPFSKQPELISNENEQRRLKQNDLYVTFVQDISENEEENFSRIPRKQRRMVRQAEKHGLQSRITTDGVEQLYPVYAESVKNLGTPSYPKNYFRDLQDTFKDQCCSLLVEHQGKVVAGVMSFFYKQQILPYYSGSLRESRYLAPNDFMYWRLMCHGAASGCSTFDFGRSKRGTGAFDFKRHWGFEPQPLPYLSYQVNGNSIPDTSSLNPKLQWAIKLWQRLPLSLTMMIGPRIARHLP